jgi:hypothetical protein
LEVVRDDADGRNVHDAYCDAEADALSEKELEFIVQVKCEKGCENVWISVVLYETQSVKIGAT